jgi:hypothetical protein
MAKVGDKIRINNMDGEPHYNGREGVITKICPAAPEFGIEKQYKGTWGGCGLYDTDDFEVIKEAEK